MRKNKRFLAASVTETVRFFLVLFLASSFGLGDGSVPGRALFGYACLPQLLFAAGFFFLWLDRPRYSVFRTLLLSGKLALALPGVFLALSLKASLRGVAGLSLPGNTMPVCAAVVFIDLFSLACLLLPVGTVTSGAGEPADTTPKESE